MMVIDEKKRPIESELRIWTRALNLSRQTLLPDVSIVFLIENWRSIYLFSRFQRSRKHISLWTTRRNMAIIQTLRKTSARAHPTRVIFSFQGYVNLAISKKVCGHRPVIFFYLYFILAAKIEEIISFFRSPPDDGRFNGSNMRRHILPCQEWNCHRSMLAFLEFLSKDPTAKAIRCRADTNYCHCGIFILV